MLNSPERIFLVGFMGSGKTTSGRQLARAAGYEFVDLDTAIELETGLDINSIFEQHGEKYFRSIEQRVLKSLISKNNIVVATGGGTPCFHNNMQWMKANGVTVYLDTHPGVLYYRLAPLKAKRPLIKSLTDVELIEFILDKLALREGIYQQADYVINGNDQKETVIKRLTDLFIDKHELKHG